MNLFLNSSKKESRKNQTKPIRMYGHIITGLNEKTNKTDTEAKWLREKKNSLSY